MASSGVLMAAAAAAFAMAVHAAPTNRFLPSGPLNMGYAADTECDDKVTTAVKNGLNVVIWSFIELVPDADGNPGFDFSRAPDLDCVAQTALALEQQGFATTHMVSVGGWAGPHPLPTNNAAASYKLWKDWNENVVARDGWKGFDGIDWDMEGANELSSPTNYFTVSCLDMVGQFAQLAKADGYRVSLVPPESYWDITTPKFDRNLTHNYPDWHPEFLYHSHSSYAYIFSRYNTPSPIDGSPTFDWVSVQLYETYSHAMQNITQFNQSPADYLYSYIPRLYTGWTVDFSSDPAVNWPTQHVALNRTQVIIGLANAWTDGTRALFIWPAAAGDAYTRLQAEGLEPRGFMFWDIGDEGEVPGVAPEAPPLYMAAGLNEFLKTRPL